MTKEKNILDKFSEEKKEEPKGKITGGIAEPKKEAVKETVTIEKEKFDELMNRLDRVEFAASKSHLANFDEKNKGDLGKSVRIRTLDGKVVVSWDDMTKNSVEKNPQGVWREEQIVNLHFEDKTSQEIELVFFNRRFVHIVADVVSKTETNDGKLIYKLKTKDDRVYEIDSRFVN